LHKTKNFPKKKNKLFATTGKTWNLIPRCQENAYSTFFFGGEAPRPPLWASRLRHSLSGAAPQPCVALFQRLPPSFQKSWIRPYRILLVFDAVIG
jgi:hypothetical protein